MIWRRRNSFRLNERFFYLALFNASLGFVFASRDLIRQRWIVRWPYLDNQPDVQNLNCFRFVVSYFFDVGYNPRTLFCGSTKSPCRIEHESDR
jgi:hypothetical protein